MTGKPTSGTGPLFCAVERVFSADPTRVWALVADPARVGEWAAVEAVGYLGTELPKVGQIVFIRTRRWQSPTHARRVEIEAWDAGSGYRCNVEIGRVATSISFELRVIPEVTGDGVVSRVRLAQRLELPPAYVSLLRRHLSRQLERKLDRIGRVVGK
ncbi:MAG: SRPBCC family protein [Actinomycetota bacterium]|nr:SRPBCC family protein [Actinomycetota bacterium]